MKRDVYTPASSEIPFDNTTPGATGMVSEDAQAAIEELRNNALTGASPGYSFGRSGTLSGGTYLQNETVPSNISGRWNYLNSASITNVYLSNENVAIFSIDILYHNGNGTGLTLLGTITTLTGTRGGRFTVSWPIPVDTQIAVRVSDASLNSPKNIVCGLQLIGTL